MSLIEVQSPGLQTTVQDLGREGFGPVGVSPSGAADPIALRISNRLVGNGEGVAALEMTLVGGTFLFPERSVVAFAGSDFGATLDDVAVDMWTSVEVRSGQTLRTGPTRTGARCYLSVRGGIDVKLFLGFIGFFHRFIMDYAIIALPLTNILKGVKKKCSRRKSSRGLD